MRTDGSDSRASARPPRQIPEDALPRSTGIAPASYSRRAVGSDGEGEEADATTRKASNVRRRSRTASASSSRPRDPGASTDPSDPGAPPEDSQPRPRANRRPTWRDLSISPDDVPVDEALHRSSAEGTGDERGGVVLADGRTDRVDEGVEGRGVADEVKPRRGRSLAGSSKAPAVRSTPETSKPGEAVCRLDPGHRRVLDLRLPGLDGSMVSLADIDADVIVLDFWGSWCRECRKSIEHNRRIQEELGGRKVQVIGIACEREATFEARRDAAAAAAAKFGINYPVLVTSKEGPCPVQQALRVQFYPTMIVLDREGNILQFEQGATDATLGRIDRVIAKAVRDGEARSAD